MWFSLPKHTYFLFGLTDEGRRYSPQTEMEVVLWPLSVWERTYSHVERCPLSRQGRGSHQQPHRWEGCIPETIRSSSDSTPDWRVSQFRCTWCWNGVGPPLWWGRLLIWFGRLTLLLAYLYFQCDVCALDLNCVESTMTFLFLSF